MCWSWYREPGMYERFTNSIAPAISGDYTTGASLVLPCRLCAGCVPVGDVPQLPIVSLDFHGPVPRVRRCDRRLPLCPCLQTSRRRSRVCS